MKTLMISLLCLTTTAFAQGADLSDLLDVLTKNRSLIEKVTPGMSKKMVTKAKVETESGDCSFTQTSTQTVLKIEGPKMIVHSTEKFEPASSSACADAGLEAYEEAILFYQDVPTLASMQSSFEASAKDIRSIALKGSIVDLSILDPDTQEAVTSRYDLTKPGFKSLVSTQSQSVSMESLDQADIDINSFNLTDILFCDNNDGDNSDCAEGDYSDILF